MKSTVQTLAGVSPSAACVFSIPDSFSHEPSRWSDSISRSRFNTDRLFLYVLAACYSHHSNKSTAGSLWLRGCGAPSDSNVDRLPMGIRKRLHSFRTASTQNPGKPTRYGASMSHAEQGRSLPSRLKERNWPHRRLPVHGRLREAIRARRR